MDIFRTYLSNNERVLLFHARSGTTPGLWQYHNVHGNIITNENFDDDEIINKSAEDTKLFDGSDSEGKKLREVTEKLSPCDALKYLQRVFPVNNL